MTKAERKLQDRLNRIKKLTPSRRRIYELDRIAEELHIEADVRDEHDRPTDEIDALLTDSLILSRLAWDLMELRDTVRGSPRREGAELSKFDPDNWRGPRP